MRLASLFSGAGGFELGFGDRAEIVLLNDTAPDARSVLENRFPGTRLVPDVRQLQPADLNDIDILTAGFPCQDVSVVGGQLGMAGSRSALVQHVFRLAAVARPRHILLENVQSIRFVHRGCVLSYLMHSTEELGYRWAYRVLDSRAFGLAQRRRRFYFLASRDDDPGDVLLSDTGGLVPRRALDLSRPIGFYWTEGRVGHGLTDDAIPTLKSGSAIGIPSPPAMLLPDGRVVTPTIESAERMQGFAPGWTQPGPARLRWRLVGNAVSPPVIDWLARMISSPKPWDRSLAASMPTEATWPLAGWGDGRGARFSVAASEGPSRPSVGSVSDDDFDWCDLSARALHGFVSRARAGPLRYPEGFLERLEERLR